MNKFRHLVIVVLWGLASLVAVGQGAVAWAADCAALDGFEDRVARQGRDWSVTPADDVDTDGDLLNAVIACADPSDVVILEPGTFRLGRYLANDAIVQTASRPDECDAALGVCAKSNVACSNDADCPRWRPEISYSAEWYPFFTRPTTATPFPQLVVVDKPLTLRGRHSAYGRDATVIRVENGWLGHGGNPAVDSPQDGNHFLVTAEGVTIESLRFDGTTKGIDVIAAGAHITDSVFINTGFYVMQFFVDQYSTYPNYPADDVVVPSWFTDNYFENAAGGPYLYGAEITAANNQLEVRTNYPTPTCDAATATCMYGDRHGESCESDADCPDEGSLFALFTGGFTPLPHLEGRFDFVDGRNNRFVENRAETDGSTLVGILVSGHGGSRTAVTMEDNQLEDFFYGVLMSPRCTDCAVTGNEITQAAGFGVVDFGGVGTTITYNEIRGSWRGIWYEWTLGGPDALTVVPAIDTFAGWNEIRAIDFGVYAGAGSIGSVLVDNEVRADFAEYYLSGPEPFSFDWVSLDHSFGPATGARIEGLNPRKTAVLDSPLGNALYGDPSTARVIVIDQAGCTNVADCACFNDDAAAGDLECGEDPANEVNDDGDLLTDEDWLEIPTSMPDLPAYQRRVTYP